MPWIKHRGGPIESDLSPGWEARLLAELALEEPKEDFSVAVLHETGWYLTVLPDGNALLDNSEDEAVQPLAAMLNEDDLVDAFRAVARGEIATISEIIERAERNA